MDILFLLIPLSLVLVGVIVWAIIWAVKSGQFDDLEGPAYHILLDDNDPPSSGPEQNQTSSETDDGPAQK
jgi:cbb3-type cytochrome oxidase maturation protein